MRILLGTKQELCYILLVGCSTGISQPFLILSRHYTLLHYYLIIYRSLSRLHISARADHPRGAAYMSVRAGGRARDYLQMVRKNLDEGATPLLIIHLLIQYLLFKP